MGKKSKVTRKKSKAALTLQVENNLRTLNEGLQSIRDEASSILNNDNPTKRQRLALRDAAGSLILLAKSASDNIPDLVPTECTKYSMKRLRSDDNYKDRDVSSDIDGLRTRTFEVAGATIDLPKNRKQYTAAEACAILSQVEFEKENYPGLSISKIVNSMLSFEFNKTEGIVSLIPCKRTQMFDLLKKYRENPDVHWPRRGRPPIMNNTTFKSGVSDFVANVGKAVSRKDMCEILKNSLEEDAKVKGYSTVMVCSPTKRSLNNYMSLLPQLDTSMSRIKKVQQKSEARYIGENSIRNAVSHVIAVACTHYQIGVQDPRLPNVEKATEGAKLLHQLVLKEFKDMPMKVILPMFISTTDDTTVFAFEGMYNYNIYIEVLI